MTRAWFWMVGLTLFALTFTYEITVRQHRLTAERAPRARAAAVASRTEAAREASVGTAAMSGLVRVVKRSRAIGPGE